MEKYVSKFSAFTLMLLFLIMQVSLVLKAQEGLPKYLNPEFPPEERATDLLSRMTLDEKIGQMTQIDSSVVISKPSIISEYLIGSVLSGGDSAPPSNTPRDWARMYNEFQRYAVEKTRLRIPIIYGIDAVHGHAHVVGATVFPQNVGMGSTWNPDLVEECARITAIEVAVTGIDWTFSPVVDVARDDRWGRTYESFGEDPYLVKVMGASAIKGYQGDFNPSTSIIACAKHYMGSGGTVGGKDQGNCVAPLNIIREVHLEPFIGGIQAGTKTIMASYCSINGEKIHGKEYFLTDILKEEVDFNGFIVSDWGAIYQVDQDYMVAVAKCINAGIDMVMVPYDYARFQQNLKSLVEWGAVPMSRIDDAVYRILVVKFLLGLFEKPYVDENLTSIVGCTKHREVARKAVQESVVLLRNDGILPLSKNLKTIYVAGPNADNIGNQCGGWTVTWQGKSGNITPGTTILEAIRNAVSPTTKVIFDEDASDIAEPYDVGIVVVGETPYAEMFGDRDSLDLPKDQIDIINRVVDSGMPTVVIMIAGRPMTGIESEVSKWNAFLMAWLPGTEGQGVADVLFGDVDATGRLSRSWPVTTSQEPINYDIRSGESYEPLFPFGYGLSYTSFVHEVNVTPATPKPTEDIKLSVKVTNKGTLSGRDVVQVYARVIYEENISTPLRKLCRFYKTPTLMPGESIIVNFTIPTPELGYYTESGKVVKEGRVEIMVGMLEMTREIPPPPSKKPPVEEPVMPKDTISLGVLLIIVTLLMIAALLILYGLKGKGSET